MVMQTVRRVFVTFSFSGLRGPRVCDLMMAGIGCGSIAGPEVVRLCVGIARQCLASMGVATKQKQHTTADVAASAAVTAAAATAV